MTEFQAPLSNGFALLSCEQAVFDHGGKISVFMPALSRHADFSEVTNGVKYERTCNFAKGVEMEI